MTDLRKAAEQALKRLDFYFVKHGNDGDFAVLKALRQALAQPDEVLAEREACAKVCDNWQNSFEIDTRGWWASAVCAQTIRARGEKPLKREWVGLTDEEVDECYYWKDRLWTTDELVRHVEAKLKEKNT